MQLATKRIAIGDRRRFKIDYDDYLCDGNKLSSVAIVPATGAVSTIDTISLNPEETSAYFFVNAAAVSETFTANVQAILKDTEVVKDTLTFVVA